MSEVLGDYNKLKIAGVLKVGDSSPFIPKSYIKDEIALTLSVNNIFCKELGKAKDQYPELSIVSIINSQLPAFQLKNNDRLNSRFMSLFYKVSKLYKTKYRSGAKRSVFDTQVTKIAIYQSELETIREMECKISGINQEKVKLEDRCRELYSRLQERSSDETPSKKSTELDELKEENRKLCDYIKTFQKDIILKHTGKTLDELHPNSRRWKITSLENMSQKALWFAESFGLTPKTIKCETSAGKPYNLDLTSKPKVSSYEDLDAADKIKLRELVTILDRFQISTTAYKELSLYFDDMSRSYLICQCKDDMNSYFHIERTPGNVPGAYLSLQNEIKTAIERTYMNSDDVPDKIQIKFSGDGTRVSRVSNFIVFSFSFIGDVGQDGNQRTIGLVSCGENYENLKTACSPILADLNELNSKGEIKVKGKNINVEVFIGGDMKFMQLLLGLCGSTGVYACPWCVVSKSDRWDTSKPWNFYHSDCQKRTQAKLKSSFLNKQFGCKNKSLVNVEPHHIVIDELHLLLRIVDVLLRNVLIDVRELDNQKDRKDEKQTVSHLDSLVDKIRSCGVTFNTWKSKSEDLEWTSLTGDDAKKVLTNLPSKLFFDIHHKTHDETVKLWEDFGSIYNDICKPVIELKSPEDIFQRHKTWIEDFVLLGENRKGYQPHCVTPYMHCLVYHVPFFISEYGNLSKFSGQGVEKNNDIIKTIHLTQTNRYDSTVDTLKVNKRREFCLEKGYVREKRTYNKTSTYWDSEIYTARASKKYRILGEIKEKSDCIKQLFPSDPDDAGKEEKFENMSVQELKALLKERGVITKARKREKLIDMLQADNQ